MPNASWSLRDGLSSVSEAVESEAFGRMQRISPAAADARHRYMVVPSGSGVRSKANRSAVSVRSHSKWACWSGSCQYGPRSGLRVMVHI